MLCIMCKKEFEEKDLDFVGRCYECFQKYVKNPREYQVDLGIPFTPVSKAVK